MTDRERLLRRVCLAPDDDTPRLIYADWCDEHGEQERAEFVRLQCRLHPYRSMGDLRAAVEFGCPREYAALRQRECDILDVYAPGWFADFIDQSGLTKGGVHLDRLSWQFRQVNQKKSGWCAFRRGFIELIECAAELWLTHGPAIVQQQPITRVVLSGTIFTREGAGLREAMLRANIPVETTRQSDAAIIWARREAGLEAQCSQCHGKGWVGRPHADALCGYCGATGWRIAE